MGMSTWIIGLRTKGDLTYRKQLAVLNACKDAGVVLPPGTAEYFGSSTHPEDVDPESVLQVTIPKKKYSGSMEEGYEVRVSDIPESVEVIRFVNSW